MGRTSQADLERRSAQMLAFIDSRTDRRTGAACLSLNDFRDALGVSESRVRLTQRQLLRDGLIAKRERFLPNGGQLENAFSVTERGYARLWAAAEVLRG